MTRIAAGLVNVDADIEDVVRSVTCPAEGSVGAGNTLTDGGLSRFLAECSESAASGERILLGNLGFLATGTVMFRGRYWDQSDTNYHGWVGRGGVFENDSLIVAGIRMSGTQPFLYSRNGGSLLGGESSSAPALVDGNVYTIITRFQNGQKQMYYCAEDIGGAGVDFVLAFQATDNVGADGSQDWFLGGPNSFTSQDRSAKFDFIGFVAADHVIDDTELAAWALDGATGFYAQMPAGGIDGDATGAAEAHADASGVIRVTGTVAGHAETAAAANALLRLTAAITAAAEAFADITGEQTTLEAEITGAAEAGAEAPATLRIVATVGAASEAGAEGSAGLRISGVIESAAEAHAALTTALRLAASIAVGSEAFWSTVTLTVRVRGVDHSGPLVTAHDWSRALVRAVDRSLPYATASEETT